MPDERPPVFGARLKQLREAAGLTQGGLAERAGLHKLGVAKLEQGLREPTWATVQALARALGVSCSAFEGAGEGAPPAPKLRGRPRKADTPPEPPPAAKGRRKKGD
jgi:transcriptional regulator with XRE-family HTH domain